MRFLPSPRLEEGILSGGEIMSRVTVRIILKQMDVNPEGQIIGTRYKTYDFDQLPGLMGSDLQGSHKYEIIGSELFYTPFEEKS